MWVLLKFKAQRIIYASDTCKHNKAECRYPAHWHFAYNMSIYTSIVSMHVFNAAVKENARK